MRVTSGLRLGALVVDAASGRAWRDGAAIALTPLERALLACLAEHPGLTLAREELTSRAWPSPGASPRAVDRAVLRLRRKLERDPARPEHLLGAHGHGYRLDSDAGDAEPSRAVRVGAARIDFGRATIERPDGAAPLTPIERRLLEVLLEMPGRFVGWPELLVRVWDASPTLATRSADTAVRRLRAKLEPGGERPKHLITRRGRGVALVGAETRSGVDDGELIGGEALVEQILGLLSRPGAVTVTGPPGVGKSRALARVAAEASRRWATAVVDLAGAGGPEVGARIAAALGVAPDARWSERVGDALVARAPALLVIDHADGAEGIAGALEVWRRRAPGARVAVGSRSALGAAAERVIEVGPLPPEAAAPWLARLAPHLDADARAAMVAAGGGIPLALELLAANGGTPGASTAGALRAALDGAWSELAEPERAGLGRLATFPAPFTAAAAAAALAPDDAQRVLAALLARSWLARAPAGHEERYRMPASIRAYALERAGGGRADGAALARWATAAATSIAHALRGAAPERGLRAWREEHPNLFAAADALRADGDPRASDVAAAIAACFRDVDPPSWMIAWLERAREAAVGHPAELRVLGGLAHALGAAGRREDLDRGLALARAAGDPAAEVEAERRLLVFERGRRGPAVEPARSLVARARALGDPRLLIRALHTLGTEADAAGALDAAVGALREAVDTCVRLGARSEEARLRGGMSRVLQRVGAYEAARKELEAALRMHPERLWSRSRLVLVLVDLGEIDEAVAQADYLAQLAADRGGVEQLGHIALRGALLDAERGALDRCAHHLGRAAAHFHRTTDTQGLRDLATLEAVAAELRGDLADAAARFPRGPGTDAIEGAIEACQLAGALAAIGAADEAFEALRPARAAGALRRIEVLADLAEAHVRLAAAADPGERRAAERAAHALLAAPPPPEAGWDWRNARRRLARDLAGAPSAARIGL